MAEVLIASALTALIGIAVLSSLRQGIILWQRVDRSSPSGDVAIFFEKCAQDLENMFLLQQAPFSGNQTSLTCPTSLKAERYEDQPSMGAVQWAYDNKSRMLMRTVMTLSDVYAGRVPEPRVALSDVVRFSLSYYYQPAPDGAYAWVDQWPPIQDALIPYWPRAVKLELGVHREGKVHDFERVCPIPLSP